MANNPTPFAVNERVCHDMYGVGTIKEINHFRTTIDFDQDGLKKFVTSMVQLERSGVAAPTPAARRARAKKTPAKTATKSATKTTTKTTTKTATKTAPKAAKKSKR